MLQSPVNFRSLILINYKHKLYVTNITVNANKNVFQIRAIFFNSERQDLYSNSKIGPEHKSRLHL